jgi:hypothetical protein
MNSQELRALQEAYNQVCELDEGMTMKDFKQQRSRQKQKDKREAEKTSPTRRAGIHNPEKSPERAARRDAAYGETGHGGALRPNKVRKAKALGELGEQVDLFDYILEHLVAEGYADTNKAALAIMANMSEEWKHSIVEKHSTFGYNADDPLDDFDQFVNKGPKTNKQKRNAIELNNKILSKPGMPVKGV